MDCKLTLQEKLRDLRDERKLTIAELADKTTITTSTLQRLESDEDYRVGYQDLMLLAKFYGVSTDYLFGLTDNRIPYNIEISELGLSDSAIGVLREGKLNNRLLSKLISHADFVKLLVAVEIYLDRFISPHLKTWNAVFELAEQKIRESNDVSGNDKIIEVLKEANISDDDFLLHKVVERFRELMVELYSEHKNNARISEEKTDVLKVLADDVDAITASKSKAKAKMTLLAKQIGLNIKGLSDVEVRILIKALEKSELYRNARGRRK